MATKTIAWATGSGNITLTYTGQGNGSISVSSDENDSFDDRSQIFNIVTTNGTPEQAISVLVKQKGQSYPTGHVFNFNYTGSVQQVTLPAGRYKLQCWGAQGGNVTGTYAVNGSKGGYSEGVLTLTKTTTLYVFVGGQGTSYTSSATQTSTTTINGGWNGGGAGMRTSRYNSGNNDGRSFPRGGGGATDISTVTSDVSYSSGRTTRDSASLLARCIVAGGGAGASARYTESVTSSTSTVTVGTGSGTVSKQNWDSKRPYNTSRLLTYSASAGDVLSATATLSGSVSIEYTYNGTKYFYFNSATIPGACTVSSYFYSSDSSTEGKTVTITLSKKTTTTSTTTSSGKSNTSMQGGGTSGKGQYPGTQSSAGSSNAGFGLGANQTASGYRYCAGGGGGGWYGGGTNQSDSSTSYINYTGGGSGFVNTAANASYRPSGYTGLQLDSGSTKDGSTSFESTSGGSEVGHSGNGYARITVLGDSEQLPSGYTQLQYIESSGKQYIDTGFKPNNNTRVVMDAQFLTTPSGNSTILGARTSATSKNYALMYLNSGEIRSDYNNVYTQTWNGVGTNKFVVDKDKETTTLNGVSQSYTNSAFQCEYNMFLCALNNAGSSRWPSSLKIYSCQIYDNGTLVRDYIPAKNTNGVCGLYDKLNNVFYSSASDTDFTGA